MTRDPPGEILDAVEVASPRPRSLMRTSVCVLAFATIVPGSVRAQVPDSAAARAEALYSAQDYLGAALAFQKLTQQNPQQPRYWTRMGSSYQRAGRLDDALSAYRHAISLTVAPVAMYNAATVFSLRGQKDSALHWLDQLVVKAGYANDQAVSADSDFAALKSDTRFNAIIERMRDIKRPCRNRKESRMFDFWVGDWDVKTPQGQPAGQSSIQLLLEGCTLLENWTDSNAGGGKSLNSYNTGIGQWQQFYTDQYGRVTEYRSSEWIDGTLRFSATMLTPSKRLLHMMFKQINPDLVRQWGEVSTDDGKTWSPSFDLYYHRRK
jgi:tetratricopeptide (TPR) repeat protein